MFAPPERRLPRRWGGLAASVALAIAVCGGLAVSEATRAGGDPGAEAAAKKGKKKQKRLSGSLILFSQGDDLFHISGKGGNLRQALNHQAGDDPGLASARFSPEGRLIVYMTRRVTCNFGTSLFIKGTLNRSRGRELTAGLNDGCPSPPQGKVSYGANGRILYPADYDFPNCDCVDVIGPDGSGRRTVLDHHQNPVLRSAGFLGVTWPDISTDGTKIVFEASSGGVNADDPYYNGLFAMDINGTALQRLTGPHTYDGNGFGIRDSRPVFSPDGRKVAFVRLLNDDGGDIYVMNSDGTNQRRVPINSDHALACYAFSPGAERLAVSLKRGIKDQHQVAVINLFDNKVRFRTRNNGDKCVQDWSIIRSVSK